MMLHRFLAIFLALGISVAPLNVQAAGGGSEFLEDTGAACLVGGAIVGAAVLIVGPAAAVTVAGTPATTAVSGGMSAIFGCGVGATSTLVYYGYKWTEHALFGEPAYPALYPLREHLQTDDAGVVSETGQ